MADDNQFAPENRAPEKRLERRAAAIGTALLIVGVAAVAVLGLALVSAFLVVTAGMSHYGSNK